MHLDILFMLEHLTVTYSHQFDQLYSPTATAAHCNKKKKKILPRSKLIAALIYRDEYFYLEVNLMGTSHPFNKKTAVASTLGSMTSLAMGF